MRLVLASLAFALSFLAPLPGEAAPAKAKAAKAAPDPRVWTIARGEGVYVLRYALARDADPDFAATCQPAAKLLQFAVEVKSKQLRSGDGVPIALSNGKRRLELAATAFLGSANGDLVVEAAVSLEPRVFDLFRDGETLTIKLPGETQTLALAGARARLLDFERVCLAGR